MSAPARLLGEIGVHAHERHEGGEPAAQIKPGLGHEDEHPAQDGVPRPAALADDVAFQELVVFIRQPGGELARQDGQLSPAPPHSLGPGGGAGQMLQIRDAHGD